MNRKARHLKTRNSNVKPISRRREYGNSGESGSEEPISKEVVKKKRTVIDKKGFTSYTKKFKHTENGVESEVEKPFLLNGLGYKVKEDDIKGECSICNKLVSVIFTCYFCRRLLCEKDTFFYKVSDKDVPLCPQHYNQAIGEFDTWQRPQSRHIEKEEK